MVKMACGIRASLVKMRLASTTCGLVTYRGSANDPNEFLDEISLVEQVRHSEYAL